MWSGLHGIYISGDVDTLKLTLYVTMPWLAPQPEPKKSQPAKQTVIRAAWTGRD